MKNKKAKKRVSVVLDGGPYSMLVTWVESHEGAMPGEIMVNKRDFDIANPIYRRARDSVGGRPLYRFHCYRDMGQ